MEQGSGYEGNTSMSTALIIEDNLNQRKLYTQELEDEGYQVVTAASGHEGVKLIQDKKVEPDVVILDIHMPQGDGIETLGQILALDSRLPVILNTAYTTYRDNFMTWCASAYIVKSSDLTELKETIKKLLANNGVVKPAKV